LAQKHKLLYFPLRDDEGDLTMADIDYDGEVTLASAVTDLDASIAWFRDVLGFELLFRADEAGWAELTSPTASLTIGLGQNEEVVGAGGTTPVFGVKDLDAARGAAEAEGVRFDGDNVEIPGMVRLATFFDPDGNSYMFAQSLM